MFDCYKTGCLVLLSGTVLALTACSQLPDEGSRHYESAYQSFGSVCVVPQQDDSDSLDVVLMQALRDKGFKPILTEPDDTEAMRNCRARVSFSVDKNGAPETMALTFTDKYTGETYHVKGRKTLEGADDFRGAGYLKEPARELRHLVDRLFPESPVIQP